jgi:hypothetical protein
VLGGDEGQMIEIESKRSKIEKTLMIQKRKSSKWAAVLIDKLAYAYTSCTPTRRIFARHGSNMKSMKPVPL